MSSVVSFDPPAKDMKKLEDAQEVWKYCNKSIPDRFVRQVDEQPTTLCPSTSTCTEELIPVVDFWKLTKGTLSESHNEILKLADACQEWGFFQVVNHEVDLKLMESMEEVAMEFFALPLEEKQKYPIEKDTSEGYGHAFVFSDDQKLDWCNMFALMLHPLERRKPHLWPQTPPRFTHLLEAYSAEVRKLCEEILKCIAVSLGLNSDAFGDMFGSSVMQVIRMNYYPPCCRPDLVMGLSPHSDGSAITVLHQGKDNPVGLQILKNGKWVPIQPLPNAFILNIGDTIEVLSNGKYKSVEHRAVTHEYKDRLSLAMFYSPSYSIELGPLEQLLNENNPPKYRRYDHGQYYQNFMTNKLQGKKNLDFAKI